MSEQPETRALVMEIPIRAPIERVWNAISQGEGLRNWFPFEARVTPGVGGDIFLAWGPDCAGVSPIEAWEPGRLLRWVESQPVGDDQPINITVELALETRGDRTVARLTNAGFGAGPSWDEEVRNTGRGWAVFMRALAHYVERHDGMPRRITYIETHTELPIADAWRRLMSRDGIAREGSVEGFSEGGRYALVTSDGDRLSGTVHVWNPPQDLAVVIEEWNDAHFWVECYGTRSGTVLKLTLSTHGVPEEVVEGIESRWQSMMDRLFPPPGRKPAEAGDAPRIPGGPKPEN